MNRPFTTLFLLTSVDGKISTGDTDLMDVDKDYPQLQGIKEGLKQYYDLERQTDLYSLNTGRVFAKIGFNNKTDEPAKLPVSFIVVDNKPHLNVNGVEYLAKKVKTLFIVTTNKDHPAVSLKSIYPNIVVFYYFSEINFVDLMSKLKTSFKVDKMTVQSGGTLNATLIRSGLIDRILLVIAPAIVGGENTSTLVDGESLHSPDDLFQIKSLELTQAKPLEHSYLLLEYTVRNCR